MDLVFKALSDETRLRILSILWTGEMCVCEIEKVLDLTQSNVSRHLTALKTAGILTSFKKAQWVFYKLDEGFCEKNSQLCAYLDIKWKEFPCFQGDLERLRRCKEEDLCKNNEKRSKLYEKK